MKTENMHKWSNSWSPVGRENEEHCTSGMQRRLEIKVKKSRSEQEAESENTFLRTRRRQKGKKWKLLFPSNKRGSSDKDERTDAYIRMVNGKACLYNEMEIK